MNSSQLFRSDDKLAFAFTVCVLNTRQATIEKTMNVAMSAQTVLAKFPNIDAKSFQQFDTATSIDNYHTKIFKKYFDMVRNCNVFVYNGLKVNIFLLNNLFCICFKTQRPNMNLSTKYL